MATGWFQRATAVFGRTEAIPQWFDVGCDCGARLKGERASTALKPKCPACGTVVFVYPATVYPIPAALRQRWLTPEGLAASHVQEMPAKTSRRKRRPSDSVSSREPAQKKADLAAEKQRTFSDVRPDRDLWNEFRSWWTPLRLVGLCIVCGVLLTGGIVYRQMRWDRAQSLLQASLDQATEAIGRQEFDAASAELEMAVQSLAILGRQDAASKAIRRQSREVTAIANLDQEPLTQRLDRWLSESSRGRNPADLSDGQWQLFDVWVAPAMAGSVESRGRVAVDLPMMVNGTAIEIWLTSDADLRAFMEGSGEATRLIFAARLSGGRRPTAEKRVAQLVLDWSQAVPMTDETIFRSMLKAGGQEELSPDTAEILRRQREILEDRDGD